MCVRHRNKTLDSEHISCMRGGYHSKLHRNIAPGYAHIHISGTEQVFCMLIYKNLPQRNYLLFSDNTLHFISVELIIRKHYRQSPQSMPLQCYPPSKSMR